MILLTVVLRQFLTGHDLDGYRSILQAGHHELFSNIKHPRQADRQTDGRTDKKTNRQTESEGCKKTGGGGGGELAPRFNLYHRPRTSVFHRFILSRKARDRELAQIDRKMDEQREC